MSPVSPVSPAGLRACALSWRPKGGPVLLHNTSFEARAGRVLAVVGANGAGKSTLLRLLYRFNRPTTGAVYIDGDDLWRMPARDCARRVAAVLQEHPDDFTLSVTQIVALGRTPHRSVLAWSGARDAEIVERSLARLGLSDFASRTFGTLSGGERQRVMVARALAQQPRVLILDEPTNHLDIRHQLEVLEMIRGLGLSVITSLHELNFAAEYSDDVLVLANGHTLAFGPVREVLNEEIIARAFNVGTRNQVLHPSGRSHFTFHLNPGENP